MKTIVIGSGVSGLTAAALLARDGHQVTICEQFGQVGGVTATLWEEGFGWDLGPLMLEGIGPGEPAGEVLAEAGVARRIRLERGERGICFPDFRILPPASYGGPYWRREYLKELFPAEKEGLDRYYRFYDQMMDLVALSNHAERAAGLRAFLLKARLWLAFLRVMQMKNWNAARVMDHFFRDPRLKAIYTVILADFVVPPSLFPGLLVPLVNPETAFDKRIPTRLSPSVTGARPAFHYVIGGCGKLVEALADVVRQHGGDIRTGTRVQKIMVEDGRVTGVRFEDGRCEPAGLVIASGGAHETFFGLVGRDHLPGDFAARVADVPFMESVLMVHVGIDFDPTPYQPLPLCYYYNTYDVEGGIERCRRGEYHEGKDGFLIYIPSLHSPEMAPPGHHAVTVYTIAPNHLSEGTWTQRRDEMADKLLAEAGKVIPGLGERAQVKVILTPHDFRVRTLQEHHSFGGVAPVLGRSGAPHRTPIRGLWFVGAQSESNAGVANSIVGAWRAVRMIRKEGWM
jgi:phytoene dehydrogenase-like protein